MKMIYKLFFIMIFLCSGVLASDTKKHESAQKVLEKMTLTYSQVEYMKSNFLKISKSTLLGTSEKTKGALEYSKNKYRLEMLEKHKTLFIKGLKNFWYINGNDVMTGNVSKAVPSIFEAVFSDPKIWSRLGTTYISVPAKIAVIKVDPKGKVPNITEMTLTIDIKKMTLKQINYIDDVNNSVDITFKNIRFFSKPKPKRFLYKIKKRDKVSEM